MRTADSDCGPGIKRRPGTKRELRTRYETRTEFSKTEYRRKLGLYWPRYRFLKKPLSILIPCLNIVTHTEMLSYNINWARESKSRDLSQKCTLIHKLKKEKEKKSATPTEVLQIS